jgi:phytoene dehydrogenase-like protein
MRHATWVRGPDAVVIGAGPNGLVAANLLADAGWSVVVLEAAAEPGGAVKTAEVTAPGFRNDLFSAFYPLAAASPVLRSLELGRWGLRWTHAPSVLAHPTDDGRVAVLHRDPAETAASLDAYAAGDGDAWLDLHRRFETIREPLAAAMTRPFPPVRSAAALLRGLGTAEALRFARFAVQPLRRWAAEVFRGDGGAALVAGCTLHTDLGPDDAGGAAFGWLLAMLGQSVGFPVPVGGAGMLTSALVERLRSRGGTVVCAAAVERVVVARGRAVGVRTFAGDEYGARRAVLAAVDAPQLLGSMVEPQHLPARLLDDLRRFAWDHATLKVDWAVSAPIPWSLPGLAGAGTVHLGGSFAALSSYASSLAAGAVPDRPYLVLGQMTTADPSRSPAGTESAWAYTHLPRAPVDVADAVRRVEAEVERHAPGFRDLVVGRHVMGPGELEAANRSLSLGALNGGTAALHQQLVWRPVPGLLGRPTLPVRGLYLASASAHPGGGVHGGPGAIAATVALRDAGVLGPARRAATRGLHRRAYR